MPYVTIKVTDEGVTRDQKQVLISATTQLLKDVLNKDPAATFVVVEEIATDNWGVGGEMVSDMRARTSMD